MPDKIGFSSIFHRPSPSPNSWAYNKCYERVLLAFKIWTTVLHAVKDLSDECYPYASFE